MHLQRAAAAGVVLRIETVINNPEGFRVRKSVRRRGKPVTEWVPLRKGVAYLLRYRDVSMSANSRYLDGLAVVSDPTAKVSELDRVTRRKQAANGRTARAFNPLARDEVQLFQAVLDGADTLRGFTNKDIRVRLLPTSHLAALEADGKRQSAKVGRILHRFHAHGLIAKIPRSRRWRTTELGRRLMATAIQVRQVNFPQLLALAAQTSCRKTEKTRTKNLPADQPGWEWLGQFAGLRSPLRASTALETLRR